MIAKGIVTLACSLLSINCLSQWTTLNIPAAGRYDDIHFIDESLGWIAGGGSNQIYKTTDGGANWTLQFTGNKYLRSIAFASPSLGFCGSLDSSFYKTVDGGNTWVDIANSLFPKPQGICGLSAPTENVIYGCGIWSSPAYIIKSIDGGNNWTTIDMSAYADALVDVYFLSADTGFVTGMSNPVADGGVVLYTTDGGSTWAVKHKTLITGDYIWKIQSPDGIHYYGSVDAIPQSGNVRISKSNDAGMTWIVDTIKNSYNHMQVIGFMDSLRGWTGGHGLLFETKDGGVSWNNVSVGSTFNRFLKINDSTAYLSGNQIYKFEAGKEVSIPDTEPYDDLHLLSVFPNPASDLIEIKLEFRQNTNCKLQLFSSDGKVLNIIYNNPVGKGPKSFTVPIDHVPAQTLYLVMRTNEGVISRIFVKE